MKGSIAVICVAASACLAHADFTVQSLTRRSIASTWEGPRVEQITTDWGYWESDVYSEHTSSLHSPGRPSWGRAVQHSTFADGLLLAWGEEGGFDGVSSAGAGHGYGFNSYRLEFTVIDSETVRTTLVASGWYTLDRYRSVALEREDGTLVFASHHTTIPVPAEVELASGRYVLRASFTAGWSGPDHGGGVGSHSLTFSIPAPASAGAFGLAVLMARRRR